MFWKNSSTYHSLNTIEISRAALEHNHKVLQEFHPEAQVCPVLKSNAYGHGIRTVAPVFDSFKVPFITVDSLYEAYELYKVGVTTPILISGYTHPDNYKVKKLPFSFCVFDLETAQTLNEYQPGCSLHVFVDTGMGREGITLSELPTFLSELKKFPNLKVEGLASHLADADNPTDNSLTQLQVKNFTQALTLMKKSGFNPKWRHLSASGGAFKLKIPSCNMIRAGLAHYGINPLEKGDLAYSRLSLQPALKLTSTVAQVKTLHPGDKVGYNATYTVKEKTKVAVLPLGYYDGLDRRLSNLGVVKIRDTYCPIIGRVSMNVTSIDVSGVQDVAVGDEVVIFSDNTQDKNSISNAAVTAKTIPYELLVRLAESVRRILI